MKSLSLIFLLTVCALLGAKSQTVTDYDGNIYHTVTIGHQVWMVENLKTVHFRDGSAVDKVEDVTAWNNSTSGAYCEYNNDAANGDVYGHLYNWWVGVDARRIAPAGWHVPTETDWLILRNQCGGEGAAGGELKEAGLAHWSAPNAGATNQSGFTALPGGGRFADGSFHNLNSNGYWWAATESGTNQGYLFDAYHDITQFYNGASNKTAGFSIRCIRDSLYDAMQPSLEKTDLLLAPNPTMGVVHVLNVQTLIEQIAVFDQTGSCRMTLEMGKNENYFDVGCLPKGMYYVRALTAKGAVWNKLLKE